MKTYVALVRAVMIGREGLHRKVLLGLLSAAGAADPRSYLSTGNVSFEVDPAELDRLVPEVEDGIEAVVGRRCELFVRTLEQLVTLVELDAFADEPFDDVEERVVTFFRGSVPDGLEIPIVSPRGDTSTFLATDGELFSVCHQVDGRMSAPGGRLEKLTGERLTTRSIGTIRHIAGKLTAPEVRTPRQPPPEVR